MAAVVSGRYGVNEVEDRRGPRARRRPERGRNGARMDAKRTRQVRERNMYGRRRRMRKVVGVELELEVMVGWTGLSVSKEGRGIDGI